MHSWHVEERAERSGLLEHAACSVLTHYILTSVEHSQTASTCHMQYADIDKRQMTGHANAYHLKVSNNTVLTISHALLEVCCFAHDN